MAEKRRDKTIFRELLLPFLSVLVFEIVSMLAIILVGGVTKRLNQNAEAMLAQQTENRGNYLLNEMVGNWSNLSLLSDEIDEMVEKRLEKGLLTPADFEENSEACIRLLRDITPSLVNTMYNKQISGIFVIFNMRDPDGVTQPDALPGVYLRDQDPLSAPPEGYADLLWERAPTAVVRAGTIAMDAGWQPLFSAEDSLGKDFFSKPFQTAFRDGRGLEAKEYGYWTTEPFCLSGDSRTAISYSIPLILEDGTVYGVLGVELLTDYVRSLLPAAELHEDRQGSYLLAVENEEGILRPVVLSGDAMKPEEAEKKGFFLREEGLGAQDRDGEYCGAVKKLTVYSNNGPFESDRWYLLGISSRKSLFAFSTQIQRVLLLSIVLSSLVGFAGILLASYRLSRPIRRLSGEVEKAQRDNRLPVLPDTGIREIDQFADSISRLSREVVESSTRLLGIIKMASVELAGYEIQRDPDRVYVTENYFPLLGLEGMDADRLSRLTPEEFFSLQERLEQSLVHAAADDGSIVYSVPQPGGELRYFRGVHQEADGRQVGLIEDITASTLEKIRIERERDSDNLTKLYARRGFKKEADSLFLKPEVLKHAGLLMIDLDNLKTTNDRFGHNFGDLYIQTAGKCFVDNTPENTLCARMSGDEFILFFYGYDSREEIRERVKELYRAILRVKFELPNGENIGLSASGGLAWYPEDGGELSELMKYADFAMYQVKRSQKGRYREFDPEAYRGKQLENQLQLEFHRLLETRDLQYAFQPIFDGRTGEVFAYEALMRPNLPNLKSPETVLRLAREEGRMHDIESITIFGATRRYGELLDRELVSREALLFINSIANESLTLEEERRYHELYARFQDRIVVEITEAENLDMELVRKKSRVEGFSGFFALDDYGSGYNSQINLLDLNPRFVKVDITIVRDVDKDADKRQIIGDIVDYGHSRGMMIIAEGLETAAELKTVADLGVDLFQGYYLARPGLQPPPISAEALETIRKYWEAREV